MEPEIEDTEVREILRPIEIIKVYETTDIDQFGSKTTVTDAIKYREHNCRNIQIIDEPEVGEGYIVTNWRESVEKIVPRTWEEVNDASYIRKGGSSRTITTYENTKVLYVHLEHINQVEIEETELILRESEITRAFETQEVKDWGYRPMLFRWDSFAGTCTTQIAGSGHTGCDDGTCDPDNPNCGCGCTW